MDMNCTNFELAVQERLDLRRLELTDELRAHAASCADCRSFWQDQRRLLAATRAWPHAEFSDGLWEAAFAELTAPAPPTAIVMAPRRASGPSARWVALCSTAALALFVVAMIGISPSPEISQNNAASVNPVASPGSDESASPMIAELLAGVQLEYLELSHSTTRTLDAWSALPRASDMIPAFTEAAPANSSPTWPRIDRPVSDRVGQAFGFLWDALPQKEMQSS
jgi:hypothetical protein